MTTRRELLAGGAATFALQGCFRGEPRNLNADNLPDVPVDIHAHIFNAQDLPIAGFVEQVLLRSDHSPVGEDTSFARALIGLVTEILLQLRNTPTAAEEYASLRDKDRLIMRPGGDLARQDQRRVEAALSRLEARVTTARVARDTARRAPLGQRIAPPAPVPKTAEERLFERLEAASGVTNADPSILPLNARRIAPPPGGSARQIARAVYDTQQPTAAPSFKNLAEDPTPDQSFFQTLRWAALLTRSRVDITGELIRLYAHRGDETPDAKPSQANGIKVFSPSIVDFTYWLRDDRRTDADRSGMDVKNQMKVTARIAALERATLILPFAPFCPLRAAVYKERDGGDWLSDIRDAVDNGGFAGIKIYPPMGFLPFGNAEHFSSANVTVPRAMQDNGVTGAMLDTQLEALYEWCGAKNVPIKSHGNNSLGADACSGKNAAAIHWDAVLQRWPNLRLNIAHFGGFEETGHTHANESGDDDACIPEPVDYEVQASDLIQQHDHVYVDLGYWTEVTGSNRNQTAHHQFAISKIQALLLSNAKLPLRIMYGSDWSMLGREEQHALYFSDVRAALGENGGAGLNLAPAVQSAILSQNAIRYLGLDREGPQLERLRKFYGDTPQFQSVMAQINPATAFGAALTDLFVTR